MTENNYRPGHRDEIVVGSRWRSRDRRDHGRTVTVVSAPIGSFGDAFVGVQSVRRSTMRVTTLLSRYDLVTEAVR